MKKSYIAPSIKVESAKLAAFCSGLCNMTQEIWDILDAGGIFSSSMTDGVCYCYHGTAVSNDFIIHTS